MTFEAWLTLAVLAAVLVAMVKDLVAPPAAMVGAMAILLVAGIVPPKDALAGFANPAPITVAALYVLARAVSKTGALTPILNATLGSGRRLRLGLARLLFPTAAVSGFLNNTPLVAMLTPAVSSWCERRGASPSQYLMPLSFATILGGMLTVMGTSTNVAVSGLMQQHGLEPLAFFEVGRAGLPAALVGIVFVVILSPTLLPKRGSPFRQDEEASRQFVVDMLVEPKGAVDGKTVERAGLRHLAGVFLAEIERDGELIAPVAPTATLKGGDRLRFFGRAGNIVDLQRLGGLASAERGQIRKVGEEAVAYFEAVVGAVSPLVGSTLKGAGFRGKYQAAVLAIHRSGQRVDAKLGEVPLRIGDSLLIVSDPGFQARFSGRNDFLLISPLEFRPRLAGRAALWVAVVALAIVALAATGVLPILEASLLGAVALVASRVLTPAEARDAIDLDVIVTIGASFALAAALERTGIATRAANGLVDVFDAFGSAGVLLGICLATVVLTELVTNTAAAFLVFPIGTAAATAVGLDPRGVAVAIAVSASASFLTPIGYQTNTMVYGPGGYRFGDYARLGAPITICVLASVVWAVMRVYS